VIQSPLRGFPVRTFNNPAGNGGVSIF
jgi:hypothetical protein